LDSLLVQEGDQENRFKLLEDYLKAAEPNTNDEEPIYLSDVIEAWSLAAQLNNEGIMSAAPVVLALLLKLLSQKLETVPYGLGICRTLLQKRQLELIARNLSAEKNKEFIISPTLRLLREAICFDGGAVAKPIFRARKFTFESLVRNMGIKYLGQGPENLQRTSTRTNAIRFFLSALKYLHPEAKRELLLHKYLGLALTKNIKDDPPFLVIEILDSLKSHVLLDSKLSRDAKGRLMNAGALARLLGLYSYVQEASEAEGSQSVADAAHEFLLTACALPSAGVLRQQSGFYPAGTSLDDAELLGSAGANELGLESIVWMDKFKEDVPVRNTVLSEFIQNLRPWSNIKHAELLLAIVKEAPELVADFFLKRKSFTFDPKLSTTWIGYAALLFNIVAMDLPKYFGHASGYAQLPPPTSVVMDNILPQPLTQKILVRCLSQKSNLISFFVTRILVMAIEKLDKSLKLYKDASQSNASLWTEASRKLVDDFCQRCPSMKDIVNSYRGIPEDDILHREAASRLIRLYYEVIPQVALTAKFDVSSPLVVALKRLEKEYHDEPRDFNLGVLEFEHLLTIAGYSPGMRWFTKVDGLSFSPFMTLLRLIVDDRQGLSQAMLLEAVNSIAIENQLYISTAQAVLTPLTQSLRHLGETAELVSVDRVWSLLDGCMGKCASAPIRYLDMAAERSTNEEPLKSNMTSSPVTMAILEQLPYAISEMDKHILEQLAKFLAMYMGFSRLASDRPQTLDTVISEFQQPLRNVLPKKAWAAIADGLELPQSSLPPTSDSSLAVNGSSVLNDSSEVTNVQVTFLDKLLSQESQLRDLNNSALTRWSTKSVDEIIDEGHAIALMKLLVSEHTSIRKEAVTNLLKVAGKIRQSDYGEKEQCWLLLSELGESANGRVDTKPMPSILIAFACHALEVLKEPLHSLYAKVNTFLTRGPVWKLDKVPLVYEILQEEPTSDDSYYSEINWLLSYLLDGLQTPSDLALFHKKRIFERLLSLTGNPYMRTPLRHRILQIVYRATSIEGGSTTLVTRFGIMNWLESQSATAGNDAWIYEALVKRVWASADQGRVLTWSRDGILDVAQARESRTTTVS
jgi:nucleolar pre-ribosomal-associated protein 1